MAALAGELPLTSGRIEFDGSGSLAAWTAAALAGGER